jgi:hypothetical protein
LTSSATLKFDVDEALVAGRLLTNVSDAHPLQWAVGVPILVAQRQRLSRLTFVAAFLAIYLPPTT